MKKGFKPEGKFATKPLPVRITDVFQENSTTKTFTFDESLEGSSPGQFIMAWLPGKKEAPFCVSHDDPFQLTICNVGEFSSDIHDLKRGDRLWIRGPYGTGFSVTDKYKNPVLVGGGYGAAPLLFLSSKLKNIGIEPTVIIGGQTKEAIVGLKKFEKSGLDVTFTTDDGSYGEKGFTTDALIRLMAKKQVDAVFGIGPNAMLDALKGIADKASIPVELSYEAHFGCGGLCHCGKCEHHGKLLCAEGPVLKYNTPFV